MSKKPSSLSADNPSIDDAAPTPPKSPNAIFPDEPTPSSDGSGYREQVSANHAELRPWDPGLLPASPRSVRGKHPQLPGQRDSLTTGPSRAIRGESLSPMPSEPAQWYSEQFLDDERETDFARATDFGEPPPEPSRADRAVLVRMEGVEAGRVYSLGLDVATLGRHPESELVIDDGGISRHHAKLRWEAGTHVVEDLGSRNGTFVQGQKISRAQLSDGDLLQLGPKVGLRYSLVDDLQETLLKRLYDSSNRDALTGAYNRKHYTDRLASEVAYGERHKTDVSLIMLDIDHFKRVNDTYGHPAGDALLKQVSMTVLRQLRTEDVFARIGGEEFVVILRGIPLVGAARLAERLRATVAALPAMYGGRAIPVTVSLGCVSLAEIKGADCTEMALVADKRLYCAKESGRNRVVAKGFL